MPPNSKILLNKGKIYTRRGGTRPKPSEENKQKNVQTDYSRVRKPVVRKTNFVTKEIHMYLRRKRV